MTLYGFKNALTQVMQRIYLKVDLHWYVLNTIPPETNDGKALVSLEVLL